MHAVNPQAAAAAAATLPEDNDYSSDDDVVYVPPPVKTPFETPRTLRVRRVQTCLMETVVAGGTASTPVHSGYWNAYELLVNKDKVATCCAQEQISSTPVMANILASRYKPRDG
jgi:hypothetical protein